MGIVISIKRKSFLKRWEHKLFSCPTFWKWKQKFTCPKCGKKYRCYWDGHDEQGWINLCNKCYNEIKK